MIPVWLWLLLIALLTHWRVRRWSLAVLLATLMGGVSGLVWFDWLGAVRTDFVPFTLLALLLPAALVSTLVGIPFYLYRPPLPPQPWPPMPLPWPLLAGVTCAALLTAITTWLAQGAAPWPALPADRMLWLGLALFLGGLVLALLSGWFVLLLHLFAAVAGGHLTPSPKPQFKLGLGLMLACTLAWWAIGTSVPAAWNQGLHRLTLALDLNVAVLLPALFGYVHGRRHPAPILPPPPAPALSGQQQLQRRLKQAAGLQLLWILAFSLPTYHQPRLAWDLVLALALFWGGVSACRRPLADDTPRARYWRDHLPLGYIWLFLACAWLLRRLF